MEEIGITNVEIVGISWPNYQAAVESPESTPHFGQGFHSADIPTPDNFTYNKYHPSAAGTILSESWFNSEEVFEQFGVGDLISLLEDARSTLEQRDRIAKYQQAQELIVQGYSSIFVANPNYNLALSERITNWRYFGGVLGFPR